MKTNLFIVLFIIISIVGFSQTYPASKSNNTSSDFITNVQFGSINNTTTGSDEDGDGIDGYDDFTSQTAVLRPATQYNLSVTIDPNVSDYVYAWIDWNDDGDFIDAGEEYVVVSNVNGNGPFSIQITTPETTIAINTRMRISLRSGAAPTSIDTFANGEVEDYAVYIDVDTDGDGVYNIDDLDADNDGILDTDENTCISQEFTNGNFENNLVNPNPRNYIQTSYTNIPGWQTTDGQSKIEIWSDLFQGVPAFEGTYFAEINATSAGSLYQLLAVHPGDIVKWRVAHRGRSGVDSMNIIVGPVGSPDTVQKVGTGTSNWVVYDSSYIVPDVDTIQIAFDAIGGGSIGNFVDDIQLYIISSTYCDSDNDGVPNIYDMDADNDGISDVIEAGGSDSDNDGIIGTGAITDLDGNGVDDSIDTTPLSKADTDGDGYVNYLDIDSDGDGIVDNIEGQATNGKDGEGHRAPSGVDINENGWDDLYEGVGNQIVLINTDSVDNPDYLDTDSDNDGTDDAIEAYDIDKSGKANTVPIRKDSDGDGLDDSFDYDESDDTDIGGPTNNGQTALTFPNDDNVSTEPIEDQDWREPLSSTLPVELISFDAYKNNNSVDLKWSTASEINNDYFLVQKSDDNVNFETIESVDGNGNSNKVIVYNSVDNNPYSGVNYYRLLQVDYDGTQDYSNTIAVNFAGENTILIYPNPSTGILNIEGANNYQINIFTSSSELIFSNKIGNSDLYKLDLSKYPKGVYIIQLISDNKTEVKRVIVQ